jgi:hypothetical protein
VRLDADINDPVCADTAVAQLLMLLRAGHSATSAYDQNA